MTSRSNVRPPIVPLTEYDARELLSKPLVDLCAEHGPTRVAGSVGCDEKTIRNARDEKSTLRLDFASNLLALDGRALDPILNHYGRRSEEHTSELQSLMRISYAVFCLKKKQ